jgi:phospholipid transport system substrate-binding protein
LVVGLALAALVAAPRRRGWAQATATDRVPGTVQAADPEAARAVAPIQALNAGLLAVMQAGQHTPFRDRFHMLAPIVEQSFDLAGILRLSVGRRWDEIEAAQQTDLLRVFHRFTIASYVANFDSYTDEQFEIAPTLRAIGMDQVVSTTLVLAGGDKVRIDYVMRHEAAAWKIVDVLLDGTISRVAVQRSDFRSMFAEGGAPALIASLERKVVDLSGGALES